MCLHIEKKGGQDKANKRRKDHHLANRGGANGSGRERTGKTNHEKQVGTEADNGLDQLDWMGGNGLEGGGGATAGRRGEGATMWGKASGEHACPPRARGCGEGAVCRRGGPRPPPASSLHRCDGEKVHNAWNRGQWMRGCGRQVGWRGERSEGCTPS